VSNKLALRGKIDELAVARRLLANLAISRTTMAAMQNRGEFGIDPPGRNLNAECGYPEVVTPALLRYLYRRNGVACRVVNIWPDECFAIPPVVYEKDKVKVDTTFEKAWQALTKKVSVPSYWHRADRLSRVGQFGVMLLGITNAGPLDRPLPGLNSLTGETEPKRRRELKLSYLRPFSQEFVQIVELEGNPQSPRYGLPKYYQLTFCDPREGNIGATSDRRVHWSRVIHLADNREESDILGTPAIEPVLNYILDLRKVSGGGAEMYWRAAFPGYSVETLPDLLGEAVMDPESIKEEFQDYSLGLKRYLAMDGVTVKSLTPQMADPTAHANSLINLICATIGIPMRIFMGSESGHLASTQDTGNQNRRTGERQQNYLEPQVIRPTIDRLIDVGVLPAPETGSYKTSWTDLNTLDEKDRALVALQKTQALQAYVAGGVEAVMAFEEYLHLVLGFTPDEARAVTSAVKGRPTRHTIDPVKANLDLKQAQLSAKTAAAAKKPAKKPGGRPAGKIQRN
jgi:hypothetical protein